MEMLMSIENRDLKPGTKLVARYKGKHYAAEIVKTKDRIRYYPFGHSGRRATAPSPPTSSSPATR
jgi:hypothetical protein